MRGNEFFFITHKFRFVFIWDLLQRIRIARVLDRRSNDDDDDGILWADEEVDDVKSLTEKYLDL